MGQKTTASGHNATAMGENTTASHFQTTAMGKNTIASRPAAVAMGDSTVASGDQATAMGNNTTASGNHATAMGSGTTASGFQATAMGLGTIASGDYATAMGHRTIAGTERSVSLGVCNDSNQQAFSDLLLVVGNGDADIDSPSCVNRNDALVLDELGNLEIAGSLTESSDRRLKEEIESLGKDVLKKLANLRPVRFEFKNPETHPTGDQIGLVAQDVRKEFPALVSKGSSGYLSLAYPKLTAVLIKGIQEQQSQIERQQATIDSLKRKAQQIQSVKERVAALEAERSGTVLAGLVDPWTVALLFGLAGLMGGLLWRRR